MIKRVVREFDEKMQEMAVKTILKGYIIKILFSILLICFISYPFLLIAAIKIDDSKPTVIVAVYTLVVYCILFFFICQFLKYNQH